PMLEISSPRWQSLYQWLATHPYFEERSPGRQDPIDVMRFRAWKALTYTNDAMLSPEVARRLFGSPLKASVSRIESFASCPFRHFARYGLKLAEREDNDVTALDLGTVYHEILEQFVKRMVDAKKTGSNNSPAVTETQIKRYAQQVGQALRGELLLSSARHQYLLQWVEKTVSNVVAGQGAVASRGRFKPKWAELTFGGDDARLPAFMLKTP